LETAFARKRRLTTARETPGMGVWAGFAGDEFVGWWVLRPPTGPDQPQVAGHAELGYRLLRDHPLTQGHGALVSIESTACLRMVADRCGCTGFRTC